MSEAVHVLRVKLKERLAAMSREICELFEGLVSLQERDMRRELLLDSVLNPRVVLDRTDVQIHIESQLDLVTTAVIKEEPEELSIKQEVTCAPVTAKTEDEAPALQPLGSEPHLHSNLMDETDHSSDTGSEHFLDYNHNNNNDVELQNSSDTDWDSETLSGRESRCGLSNEEEVVFECSLCQKTFLRKGFSVNATGNNDKINSLTCLSCSAGSKHRERPSSAHTTKKKRLICKVCAKCFSREDNLKNHMLIHKGKRPHCCQVCTKSFTEAGHLKAHARTHTGEKPFSCSVCEKCFTHRATRDRHERSHSGERPHGCSECGTEFKQRAHYLSHLKVHSRERPFSCPVCDKTYTRNSHVTLHMKVHARKPNTVF